ncbi:hypothetical protein pb186bvf_015366 [Paramecium bursaria]
MKIPKILFIPSEMLQQETPVNKRTIPQSPLPSPPKYSVQAKIKLMNNQRETHKKQKELEFQYKEKKSSHLRQLHIINRLHNIEFQQNKWKEVRNNVEFLQKAKMQYVYDYYENLFDRSIQPEKQSRIRTNKSLSDYDQKKEVDQRKKRLQQIAEQQYKNNIDHLDLSVKLFKKQIVGSQKDILQQI